MSHGKVILVGAGPGDPELLTLRGQFALQTADLVLYDYLVNPDILRHARPGAECICLGSHGRATLWPAAKIHEKLIDAAHAGRQVVRLKGGDPLVFGRAAGELEALRAAGVRFEIVPGVTAALAAAAYAGLPVTDRDAASAVAFFTGQEDAEKGEPSLDYHGLAQFPGTLMVYMGVTTARQWTERLILAGRDPGTPVALIRRCSWPDQQVISCRLDEVGDRLTPYSKFPPPVVAIVGEVARDAGRWNWLTQRPLFGQSVMLTRACQQGDATTRLLREKGAEVVEQPAVVIQPPECWDAVDAAIERLEQYRYLIFTSANGVEFFLDRCRESGRDWRALSGVKIVAVGPATAAAIAGRYLIADFVPSQDFRAESLVELLGPAVRGARCLWPRASRGRDLIAEQLAAAGAVVDAVVVYESRDVIEIDERFAQRLAAGSIDWVTATSPAIAHAAVQLLGTHAQRVRWASLSPLTSAALRQAGVTPTVEASEARMESLVAAICRFVRPGHDEESGAPAANG